MAYLLIFESRDGDKEWRVFTQERDAQEAALVRRAGGEDATVVNTCLADPHGRSFATSVPGGVFGFRL